MDCHAEVLARRGLKKFLLRDARAALRGGDANDGDVVARTREGDVEVRRWPELAFIRQLGAVRKRVRAAVGERTVEETTGRARDDARAERTARDVESIGDGCGAGGAVRQSHQGEQRRGRP